jgi:hypothetical protein
MTLKIPRRKKKVKLEYSWNAKCGIPKLDKEWLAGYFFRIKGFLLPASLNKTSTTCFFGKKSTCSAPADITVSTSISNRAKKKTVSLNNHHQAPRHSTHAPKNTPPESKLEFKIHKYAYVNLVVLLAENSVLREWGHLQYRRTQGQRQGLKNRRSPKNRTRSVLLVLPKTDKPDRKPVQNLNGNFFELNQ